MLLFFSENIRSQNFKNSKNFDTGYIKGKIKNTNDKNLEFATVSLYNVKDNMLVEGTITNSKGKFLFTNVSVGKYRINISFIGYKDTSVFINKTDDKINNHINTIYLKQNAKLLSEINIEDRKLIYETKIDKIVYNAENDLNETENNATDVLRKAPLVSVDLEDNISLRGSRNIKFLVNGKASSFFSSDVNTALQMIPADEIKSIEIITSPGAKFDGDGDAGIINIITKKKRIDGYKASIRTNIGSKTLSYNTNFNTGKGKTGFSIRAGSFGSGLSMREGNDIYKRYDWNSNNDTNQLYKIGTSENQFNGYRGSINGYYDINKSNTINSSLSFRGKSKPNNTYESVYYSAYNEETDTTFNYTKKTNQTLKLEWTTDYIKKYPNHEGKELSIALQIGGNINESNTKLNENNTYTINQNDEKIHEETFQLDFVYPLRRNNTKSIENQTKFKKKRKQKNIENSIETGFKIINRNREIVYSDLESAIYSNAEQFNYNQLVASSYFSTQIKLPYKIGLKAGVRNEYTKSQSNYNNSSIENEYNNILPSLTLSKSFSPINSIKISHNQRITRPSIRQINTNVNRTDNKNITTGNPYLIPTETKQYEVGINSFKRVFQSSIQIYYKHSKNVIESFLDTVENGISKSTYKNIGESKQNGISLFTGLSLKKINLRGGLNLYTYSGKDIDLGYTSWTKPVLLYSYNFNFNVNITKRWKAESFAFYRSPSQSIQGTSTSFSMMSIGVKRDFKNKKGSFGFRIIEPFNKNKIFRSDLDGEFFSQSSTKTIPFRSFAFSFNYSLGKLKFKQIKTNIKNDDIQNDSRNEF
tara:strand:+ start:10526 stop:12973 length:2448 start_codon:yes stop_codon:yes gene_type:complete